MTRPDARKWQFAYPDSSAKFWRQDRIAENTQIDGTFATMCSAALNGDFITITHPSGAVGSFALKERCVGQAAVPKLPEHNHFGQGDESSKRALESEKPLTPGRDFFDYTDVFPFLEK